MARQKTELDFLATNHRPLPTKIMPEHDDNMQDETLEDAELAPEDSIGEILNLQAEVDALKAEKLAFGEKLARVQADFANSRRRIEADFQQRFEYANEELIKSLLPTLDDFERALRQDPLRTNSADILKGMEMVYQHLTTSLAQFDLVVISPKPGDDFDHEKHQALIQQPSQLPEGKVNSVLQLGYMMKGRVLRPAQVAVSASK